MEKYLQIIQLLNEYFKEDTRKMFLSGGCFFLAELLHRYIHHTKIMINREKEHCATEIGCHGVYDITGKIKGTDYRYATKRDIAFMKKNYIPKFNEEQVLHYVSSNIKL